MTLFRELGAVARLDLAEVLRSRWALFTFLVYAGLAAAFVLVGMRESSMLAFTGLGRVLLSLCHALLLLLPLFALTATGQVINRAREDGTLEFLFTQPIRRAAYFGAISLTRLAVLTLPLWLLFLALGLYAAVAFDEAVAWGYLLEVLVLCTSVLVAFVGLGTAVSTWVRNQARATIWLLGLWALGVALLDFALVGAMLQWRVAPEAVFLLASLNPVQAARMALLSGASTELSVLGPVGFYLSNKVGSTLLFVWGTAWPAAVGLLAWFAAFRSFRRADIV